MKKVFKTAFFVLFPLLVFLLPFFFPSVSEAKRSNCVVTTVGTPLTPPVLPTGCQQSINGIELPPNLTGCIPAPAENSGGVPGEYCPLPPSTPDAPWEHHGTKWGSKEMMGVLYTVAKNWHHNHNQGHLIIDDITSDYHLSHFWGIAVDVLATSDGHDCVASIGGGRCSYGKYNTPGSIELGEMIVDTGYFDTIWHNVTAVNLAIFNYAHSKDPNRYTTNSPGNTGIRPVDGHYDHFHLNIDRANSHTSNFNRNTTKSQLLDCRRMRPNTCN